MASTCSGHGTSLGASGFFSQGSIAMVAPPGDLTIQAACPHQVALVLPDFCCAAAGKARSKATRASFRMALTSDVGAALTAPRRPVEVLPAGVAPDAGAATALAPIGQPWHLASKGGHSWRSHRTTSVPTENSSRP